MRLKAVSTLSAISAADWDKCAGTDHPFTRYAFLSALEDSGSTGTEAGWIPRHLVLESPAGQILGVAPAYLKTHSWGEYVFDHGWARAYERAGGAYYPKLQCAIPFTPATGPRLLLNPTPDPEPGLPDARGLRALLVEGLVGLCDQLGLSSAHVTFPLETEWQAMGEWGLLQRVGRQYHWVNNGYGSFDDFLAALSSRKRKNIRKEREAVRAHDIELVVLQGEAITEAHWDAFYAFYIDTSDRKWGMPYLERSFFSLLGERMGEQVVLILARPKTTARSGASGASGAPCDSAAADGGGWVAGALNLRSSTTLYGRHWGCAADYRFLHFEACYYQAIDYAIGHGLTWVEAGAQGEHKIQRGYLPVATYSAHYIADPGFRAAVADFLRHEARSEDAEREALSELSPFRRGSAEEAPAAPCPAGSAPHKTVFLDDTASE